MDHARRLVLAEGHETLTDQHVWTGRSAKEVAVFDTREHALSWLGVSLDQEANTHRP